MNRICTFVMSTQPGLPGFKAVERVCLFVSVRPSVRPSVRHVVILYLNERTCRETFPPRPTSITSHACWDAHIRVSSRAVFHVVCKVHLSRSKKNIFRVYKQQKKIHHKKFSTDVNFQWNAVIRFTCTSRMRQFQVRLGLRPRPAGRV